MAAPRVFVSSTFYDLRYIRENLKYFIKSLGYEPVLSEEGGIYYDPNVHVQEAAVAEVPSCQMLVLIIGGRYGQHFKPDPKQSVTNAEYKKAIETKVPIFALVERDVHEQYRVYRGNKENPQVDATAINYPAVDSVKIFDFIEEAQGQAVNNALIPFADFGEIESYLRQQWASMMFSFLTSESEAHRVADTLTALTEMSQKIEFLSREVLNTVGDNISRAAARLYDITAAYERKSIAVYEGQLQPTPRKILMHDNFADYIKSCDVSLVIQDSNPEGWISHFTGSELTIVEPHAENEVELYVSTRAQLLDILGEHGVSVEEFLKREDTA